MAEFELETGKSVRTDGRTHATHSKKPIFEPSINGTTRVMLLKLRERLEKAKTGDTAIRRMVFSSQTYRDLEANCRVFAAASSPLKQTFAGVPYCVDLNMKPYTWRFE